MLKGSKQRGGMHGIVLKYWLMVFIRCFFVFCKVHNTIRNDFTEKTKKLAQ